MTVRPVLRMYGAKWGLAEWIVAHLPRHAVYVEPFAGTAAVLLTKSPARVEVLNDLDGEIVDFFRVLRDKPEALIRAVSLTPYARVEAQASWETPPENEDDVERARRFLVRSWQTIGGPTTRWKSGFRFRKDWRMAVLLRWWQEMPERLAAVAFRLRGVLIENRDYREILEDFDGPETLFYLDPPYPPDTRSRQWRRGGYRFEFSEVDHRELLERITALRGMVVLSSYPSPLYEDILSRAGWRRVERAVVNGNGKPATEILWLNPAATAQLGLAAQLPL